MPGELETYYSNLRKLSEEYEVNRDTLNEATTRLRFIDTLFLGCLGWERADVITEEYHSKEYADYTFLAPNKALIVEAKKEGEYFEIPYDKDRFEYPIKIIFKGNEPLESAIKQVAGYCQSRGVPYGSVCNGHQIIAFIATRSDGISPFDGRAVVFPTLIFMLSNFNSFWNCLSKPAIEDKILSKRLLGAGLPKLPPKLSSKIYAYPRLKTRNEFQDELKMISETVLEDIVYRDENEREFLENCYCQSGALSQNSLVSKNILRARYAALFEDSGSGAKVVPATDREGPTPELFDTIIGSRPVILIGDMGVGKTTFIRYHIKIGAREEFEKAIVFYIDFGSQGTFSGDLKGFVLSEIERQLFENYGIDIYDNNFVRGVYHGLLSRFRSSIYQVLAERQPDVYEIRELEELEGRIKNKPEHLKQSLIHIFKGHRKQIVIFLDNSDQRPEEDQEQVFLNAQEISSYWPVIVYVSLRPETFNRSARIGALTGYYTKVFGISPPRVDDVLSKRLLFAEKITAGETRLVGFPEGIKIRLVNLRKFLRVFYDSIGTNDDLVAAIDHISGGNIRTAIKLVEQFFGSAHVNTRKIIDVFDERGFYQVALHEFLRAVIFGDLRDYEPTISPFANIFDISTPDPKEHFLLPEIVNFMYRVRNSDEEGGFLETPFVYDAIQGLGFTVEQIDLALNRGLRKKLFETSSRLIPDPGQEAPRSLRVTPFGVYHTHVMASTFAYIDAISVDTPIFKDAVRDRFKDVDSIFERIERAVIFCAYLDDIWSESLSAEKNLPFDWPEMSSDLKADIGEVHYRAEKQARYRNKP
jgi:GTPase SAR1 family protein